MNAKDMIAFFEYAKSFDKPQKTRWRRKDKEKEFDLVSIIRKKKEELKLFEEFMKEQEKLTKKEEKKLEGHKFTFAEGVILAFIAQMFIGPVYKAFTAHMGIQ